MGDIPLIVSDGEGGAFVAWRDARDRPTTNANVFLQRVTASGEIAPGWPSGGLPVCIDPALQDVTAIANDGLGGVFVVWLDLRNAAETSTDSYALRIQGDGTIAPGWPVNGAPVSRSPGYEFDPQIVADGQGGALVLWEDDRHYDTLGAPTIYLQHLTASGVVAEGWPSTGLRLSEFPGYGSLGLVADRSGGAIGVWIDARRAVDVFGPWDLYAQRVLADGTIAPGWPAKGRLVLAEHVFMDIAPDGSGGAYVAGAGPSDDPAGYHFFTAQRITPDGSLAVGWPQEGVSVCSAPGVRENLVLDPDGLGGMLAAWYDARSGGYDIYAMRLQADGTPAVGWTQDGVQASDPQWPNEFVVDVVGDGAGGAYVAWERNSNEANEIRLQHLTAAGAVDPAWPQEGRQVAEPATGQFTPKLASDDARGVIVAWDGGNPGMLGIHAQRIFADGPVAALASLAHVEANADRVTLVWYSSAEVSGGFVERRTESTEWQQMGPASETLPHQWRFEDSNVLPRTRYGYRLRYLDDGIERVSDETWVDVPLSATLRLEGFSPNPARGVPTVSFALENSAPALLELFNATGRRIGSYSVGDRGAGSHLLQMNEDQRLRAGIYWIRLTSGARSLTTKGIILN